jgi:uncharacterized membrane protein
MTLLKNSLTMKLINKLFYFSAALGFLGFLDSTYLTIVHFKNIIPPCDIHFGCETVLTSNYSMLGPLPLALFGAIFYLAVIVLSILAITNPRNLHVKALVFSIFVGFLISLYLFLVQLFIIHAFCQYCLLSEITSTLLLIPALLTKQLKNR